MQVRRVGYGIRGFSRVARLGTVLGRAPRDVQTRLEILHFFEKHGLEATLDAFGVSRRTPERWQAALKVPRPSRPTPPPPATAVGPRRSRGA